jgi:hypothetical protein
LPGLREGGERWRTGRGGSVVWGTARKKKAYLEPPLGRTFLKDHGETQGGDMATVESKNFESADETRTPDKATIELVNLAGGQIGRYTFQPGWRWSESIKPVVKTETCQVEHVGYVVSGGLHVEHEDGTTGEATAGEVYRIAPGHDASVVGDEPVVLVEFQGAAHYAKG